MPLALRGETATRLLTRVAFADAIGLTQLQRRIKRGRETRRGALGSLLMRGEGKLSENTRTRRLASRAGGEGRGGAGGQGRVC